MIPSANCPLKNPTKDPTEERKASLIGCFCLNSTKNTAMNGNRIIPNGGKIKDPTRTAIAAARSPCFVPPNFLTDNELAKISAIKRIPVKISIETQKNVVN